MLDQLEEAGRLPEELLADTLYTGDENVQAAAARGVDLVGPVPGRAPESAPETLTVDDFALDERTGTIDACPAGHRPTSCSRDAETATTRVEMPASACAECPFRKQCPIEQTRDGKFTLEFTDKERRLAGRRVEEATDVFQERYAPRSGIESTNSGLKNRLGLGQSERAWSGERVACAPAQGGGLERAVRGINVPCWNVRPASCGRCRTGGCGRSRCHVKPWAYPSSRLEVRTAPLARPRRSPVPATLPGCLPRDSGGERWTVRLQAGATPTPPADR